MLSYLCGDLVFILYMVYYLRAADAEIHAADKHVGNRENESRLMRDERNACIWCVSRKKVRVGRAIDNVTRRLSVVWRRDFRFSAGIYRI